MAKQFFMAPSSLFDFSPTTNITSSLVVGFKDEEKRAKQFFKADSLFSPVKITASSLVENSKDQENSAKRFALSLFTPAKNTAVGDSKDEENSGVSLEKMKVLMESTSCIPQPRTMEGRCITRKPAEKVSKPSSIIIIKKRKMMGDNNPCCSLAPKPKQQKIVYTSEGEEEDETKLRLYEEPWKIKKILTKSDVNTSCRLLLSQESIHKHIIPLFSAKQATDCGTVNGTKLKVFDFDTRTEHELTLKRWKTDSYVLTSSWIKEFKNRRKLQMGDEVGLFWNPYLSRLYFSLLKKAAA
ncbi:putative B3 domain-containing protein At1g78640 [Cornus florida]|uniref:putative B3 domain-containing protein At1g78640 n=1 Tax=Cornus florida TaxID=4283 RepID=UPI0028A12393|nr:putative B3 domain-containing protein At1g78640 [Cornus florida]